ncbi:hypothetical protein IBX73_07250 [candidate division WOR-3 bacterium]|nr:hypothetical protein [candidate division WOR-3 bacterium]
MIVLFLMALTPFRADRVEIIEEERERIVYLLGNVVIESDEAVITCDEARISEAHGWVRLSGAVKVLDANGEINARSATYYFNENRAYLSDSVIIVTARERIMSDSLYYDGTRNWVEMYGDVLIEDDRNNMVVSGESGWYDLARDEGSLSGDPELRIMREDKTPIVVYANAFALLTRDDQFRGYDAVRAVIDSINIQCDTVSYDLRSEAGEMVRPVIREKNNELTGTRGEFRLRNREIELLDVVNGRSVYYTKEGSKNTVEGGRIAVTFSEGRVVMIRVDSLPRGVLYLKRSQEGAVD